MANKPRQDEAVESLPRPALGRRIRRLRIDRGWTQARLGIEMGFEANQRWARELVGRHERGATNMTANMLKKYAKAFGVSLSELIDDLEEDEVCETCGK